MFVIKSLLVAFLPLLALGHDKLCLDKDGNPKSTGPFQKPDDCDFFYQCSNGKLHTMPCAPGTVFNPEIKVCDWPRNVPSCEMLTVVACENVLDVEATCPHGSVIVVKGGFYGRNDGTTCPHKSIQTTECAAENSAEILKSTCNGKNKCTLTPTNGVFGDPCVNTYKYIEMDYYCKKQSGQWHQTTICEHDSETLSCPEGMVIWVNKGYYGRDDGTTCPHKSIKTTTCSADESLEKLRETCNGKNSCVVQSSNSVFGDPCVGTYKYVEMTYFCHKNYAPCEDCNGNAISTDPFAKPGDCHHFYQCSNGVLHTMPCAPGTVFNPSIKVCDHPRNVPGCS